MSEGYAKKHVGIVLCGFDHSCPFFGNVSRKERQMAMVRECVRKMTGYVPGESSKSSTVVKLNQNENRYSPSAKVLAAIQQALHSLDLYPDSTSRGVREAAAKVYGVRPEEVMATNGSDEMLRILFQSCCDPRDAVTSFYPSYTYYETLAAMQDADYRLIDFEGEFHIPDRLDLSGSKLAFLVNPNAPTGTVFPESEVRRFIESVTDGIAVVDEAYADFCGQTAIPLIREYKNLVVVRTFSKSYSLAGLRAGLGFMNRELLEQFEKVRDYYNVDRLAQAGAEAALLDQEWLRTVSGKIIATRERTIKTLTGWGVKAYDSGANFILVRLSSPEMAEDIFKRLRDMNVLVRYFRSRGVSDCLRVSIGTDADMDAFLTAMEKIIARN